jgi:Uma2 family endonuclease
MENIIKEPAPKYNYYSPGEYLELERASDEKHEYFDGQIYLMSGASLKHEKVATNLILEIGTFLKGKKCKILAETMRVTNKTRDAYMYPDLLIYCEKEELEDDHFDTLLNPSVILEILSPSTRSIDKGRKFLYYQEIASLKEYFMVDTLKQRVYVARKQSNGKWAYEPTSEKGSIFIETISFHLSLSDIYNGTGIE